MGNSIYNKRVRLHAVKGNKQQVSYFNIMLQWIYDILDKQAGILEAKGVKIIYPIVGINMVIMSWFARISFTTGFDLFKNIILSLCGCAIAVMGVINLYMSTHQKIKKYRKGIDINDKEKTA